MWFSFGSMLIIVFSGNGVQKRPLVTEFGTKWIFEIFMWIGISIPFKQAIFEGSTHMLTFVDHLLQDLPHGWQNDSRPLSLKIKKWLYLFSSVSIGFTIPKNLICKALDWKITTFLSVQLLFVFNSLNNHIFRVRG